MNAIAVAAAVATSCESAVDGSMTILAPATKIIPRKIRAISADSQTT